MPDSLFDMLDPYEANAARTRRRAPVREPDPRALYASQGGVSWEKFLPSEERAMQSAASLQAGGDYNPRDVLLGAIGATAAPVAGPAGAGTLGAGIIRPVRYMPSETGAAAPAVQSSQSLFDLSRLREVPDVPQFNLQRYEPPRGVPERTQKLATPENLARINEVVRQGEAMGGREWYNTEPLRQAFIGELGAEKGPAAYRQYLDLVAATSPRSKVGENVRNASYYYGLAQRGEPLPARTGNALNEPLPSPYGHIAQRLHVQNANNVLNEGGWPVLQNPKPASFVENLAGNQMPVTIDTHNIRLLGSELDKPAKTEYGFLERAQQEEAAKLGMTPAQYQASAWIGGGAETGLKSSADPSSRWLRIASS